MNLLEAVYLLNLLLYELVKLNQEEQELKVSTLFTTEGELTLKAHEFYVKYQQDSVSFLRSENPLSFPVGLSSSIWIGW